MNYPVWVVPHIGSGWVIGIIAIFHVMISQFAVGGGLYLPWAEYKAVKQGKKDWLPMIREHSRFFFILTGVFGTVSGVGIWFAIGLVHPEATSALIHNFVFGWAIEWGFFLVELTAAAVYYYTWGRISEDLHLKVGWLYAIASFLTLVIINGILAFMLTPGSSWLEVAGTGQEASRFWQAFFNPTYWPSLLLRCCVCASLAGVWALVTCSRLGSDQVAVRTSLIRWTAKWLIPMFVAMPLLLVWYLVEVPASQRVLLSFGMNTIGSGAFTQVTRTVLVTIMTSATIVGVVYFFAYRLPQDFSLAHALAVVFLALCATGATEYAREMLRKPYVIGDYMYSNGVRKQWVAKYNKDGYLAQSQWVSGQGNIHYARGQAMFRGQCLACHTTNGYRPMKKLLASRDREGIGNLLAMLNKNDPNSPYHAFMPPLVGTPGEIKDLGDYLAMLIGVPVPAPQVQTAAVGH